MVSPLQVPCEVITDEARKDKARVIQVEADEAWMDTVKDRRGDDG